MVMNKKGSLGLAIVSSIVVFIIGLMMINFVMPEVTTFRTDMNCADAANISDGTKLLCLAGDATVPYFILIVFSLVIGGLTSRMRL
jgi:hypothetical protein